MKGLGTRSLSNVQAIARYCSSAEVWASLPGLQGCLAPASACQRLPCARDEVLLTFKHYRIEVYSCGPSDTAGAATPRPQTTTGATEAPTWAVADLVHLDRHSRSPRLDACETGRGGHRTRSGTGTPWQQSTREEHSTNEAAACGTARRDVSANSAVSLAAKDLARPISILMRGGRNCERAMKPSLPLRVPRLDLTSEAVTVLHEAEAPILRQFRMVDRDLRTDTRPTDRRRRKR